MNTGYTFWIRGKSMTKLKHKFIVSSKIENIIPTDCKRHRLIALLVLSCLVDSAKDKVVETSVVSLSHHLKAPEKDILYVLSKLGSYKNQVIQGYNGGNKVYVRVNFEYDRDVEDMNGIYDYAFEMNLEEYDEEMSLEANVLLARLRVACSRYRNEEPDLFEKHVPILVSKKLLEYTSKKAAKELRDKEYIIKLKNGVFFGPPVEGSKSVPYVKTGKYIVGIAITEKGWGKTTARGVDNPAEAWFDQLFMEF